MIYRVSAAEKIHFSDPLHVGRFFPHLERRHGHLVRARQDLILYLANIHSIAVAAAKRHPHRFSQLPMRLMTLREWVYDYKTAFDHFFEVAQHGYHVGEKHEISLVIPRKLPVQVLTKLLYIAPPRPSTGVISKVFVQQHAREEILSKLASSGRFDLQAPVEYLLDLPCSEVNFYFEQAGKLQLRDTSTFPVPAIETFPAWLREALFGPGIDIEAAYTQFLIEHLKGAHRESALQLLYPDLLRSLQDKEPWRRELCVDVLGMEETEESIALVKRLIMSLANGSRISPAILTGSSGYSSTRDAVLKVVADTSMENLTRIGERLSSISRQYSAARKAVCTHELRLHPSRANQKKVFLTYFQWEREARYRIWEAVDQHGIMVHDGIDGIPARYLTDIPGLVKSLNLRLT